MSTPDTPEVTDVEQDVSALYPLSPAQEGILFHARLAQEESAPGMYVQQLRGTINGELAPETFARAFEWVTHRHEALRSCFLWEDVDAPVWVIYRHCPVPLRVLDEGNVDTLAAEERALGFDLTRAPLSRLLLVRQGPARWVLVWTQHHLILDGWSLPVVMFEFLSAYGAMLEGRSPRLPPAPSLHGYAEWLHTERSQQAAHLPYFRSRFASVARPSALPCARRSTIKEPAASHQTSRLTCSNAETQELGAFARAHGVTIATLICAAWATVLGRHDESGSDAIFGVTFAGRPPELPDVDRMVGMFINTLPLRAAITQDPTVSELLRQVGQDLLELQTRAATPLAAVAACSAVPAGTPLISTLVVVENYPEAARVPGVALALSDIETTERIDVPLSLVVGTGPNLTLSLLFDPDRVEAAFVPDLLSQVRHVLLSMAQAPAQNIGQIPLHSATEALAVRERRSLRQTSPRRGTLQESFRAIAQARGDAIALRAQGQELTYTELLERTQHLAGALTARGVRPGDRVAVCVSPSFDLVAAVLAVLWVGAAYVPTDPRHPAARRKLIADDAGATLLLHDGTAEVPEGAIGLHLSSQALQALPGAAPMHEGTPDDAAYVLYTSGSTGTPKGVRVTHHNVLRLFWATQPWFGLGPSDTFTLFHSLAFDFSVWELFGALLFGGRLVIVPAAQTRLFDEVRALLSAEQVTVFSQTPSAFEHFMRADEASQAPLHLRLVIFGGEALVPRRLGPWFRRHAPGKPTLVNMYGITETTVHVTYRVLTPADVDVPAFTTASPIGHPIPDLALRVCDAQGNEVPSNVPGELWVGGDGVSDGYPQLPTETTARFITDPTGQRWYRSGDRGREVPGLGYEFLGRLDAQLKVRGHRIEPGEIEGALRAHPSVAGVAVTTTAQHGETELLACVVPADPGADAQALTAALRLHLRTRLPEPFIPRDIVVTPALPLTSNGKLDVAQLTALMTPNEGPQARSATTPSGSPHLELVTATLGRALGKSSLGPDDDIFRMGAHSLVVAQAAFRLRQQLGLDLPLRALFEHRTPRALAAFAESLARDPLPPLRPADTREPSPLSFAQRRLWFLHQLGRDADPLHGQRSLYNVTLAVEPHTELDIPRLRQAVSAVARRHAILRSTFEDSPLGPVQRVHQDLEIPVHTHDVPEGSLEATALALAAVPFDLERGPLARVLVLRDEHRATELLVLVLHHVVTDGWSMGILVRELLAFYDDSGATLPVPPLQYADFARWQAALPRTRIAKDVEYFRAQLADLPPVIDLGADHERPAVPSYQARELSFDIDAHEGQRVEQLALSLGVTPAMLLLSVLHLLVSQRSGQHAPCIGVSSAGRGQPELDGLVGFFVNVLPVRAQVGAPHAATPNDEPYTFRELTYAVREACLQAYAREHVPFEDIAQAVGHPRSLAYAPVFQVNFVHQGFDIADLWQQGAGPAPRATPVVLGASTVRFDLVLTVTPQPGGAHHFTLTAATDLFDLGSQQELARQYLSLLREALREADEDTETPARQLHRRALGPLPITPAEPVESEASLPALFLAQVQRTPNAQALLHGNEALSYAELASHASQVAALLARIGVREGARVAICMRHGFLRVAAMLGVWCHGAAFVPVDPELPLARRALLLAAAQPSVVLVDEHTEDELPSDLLAPVQRLTSSELLAAPAQASVRAARPDDLAYLIFTSGSTGMPKGVCISHRGVGNLAMAQGRLCNMGPQDTVLAFASFAFDAHISELGLALAHGATLDLGFAEVAPQKDPLRTLRERDISVVTLPPSLLRMLDPRTVGGLPALRTLLAAGEALFHADLAAWQHPQRRIFNAYGPTEITVCATMHEITPSTPSTPGARGRVPIGRPLPGVVTFVADAEGCPLPPGFVGELLVEGVGVALGYLEQRSLDPTDGFYERTDGPRTPGRTVRRGYRTRDLVRQRHDGTFEYLGRSDDQIKLRGVRIELAEIERTLEAHPSVREAVARLVDAGGARERIVAYVAGDLEQAPEAQLLAFARTQLPKAAVPTQIVRLDALPRGVSGKVQRNALPVPVLAHDRIAEGPVEAPMPGLETQVAAVWAEALSAGAIHRSSDFFALGGHSLLALQVAARLGGVLGKPVPLRLFFEHSTLSAFASALDATAGSFRRELPRASRQSALPLSFGEERLWFLEQLQPGTSAYVLSAAFRLRGDLDLPRLARALDAVATRHEALRTTYPAEAGVPRRQIAEQADLKLGLHALGTGPETEDARVAQALADDAQRGFDLASGPLVRVRLLALSADHHVLSVAIHHMLADADAMRRLVRDLGLAYAGASLPALARDYADFAAWERTPGQAAEREARLEAAIRRLQGAPPFTTLPADQAFRPVPAGPAGRVQQPWPLALDEALAARPGESNLTPFMVATAALSLVLWRFGGDTDLVLGAPIMDRPDALLEPVVGNFLGALVLRIQPPSPSVGALLAHVRQRCLEAFEDREVPFEQLASRVATTRDLGRNPVFQVMLSHESRSAESAPARPFGPAVEVTSLPSHNNTAKLDLSLSLAEAPAGTQAILEYRADRFHPRTAELLLQATLETLAALLRAGDATALGEVLERIDDILRAPCPAPVPAGPRASMLSAIERAVQAHNDKIAVVASDGTLTYGQLFRAARGMARRHGFTAGARIGVRLPRNRALVPALLGTWASGAAYVPLPDGPASRVDRMTHIGDVDLVLTEVSADDATDAPSPNVPEGAGSPDQTAYVLFTSGSTGDPKGVAVTQANLENVATHFATMLGLAPGQTWLATTKLTFDIAALELFAPLLAGATVHIAPDEDCSSGERLAALIARVRPTIVQGTPSMWRLLMDGGGLEALRGITLLVGGEAVTSDLAQALLSVASRVFNVYGPTETTIWSTAHEITWSDVQQGIIPIGRPIRGTRIDVVDDSGAPRGIGFAGEIAISGAGVADGYVAPDQGSRRSFVTLPWGRAYLTQDRGRFRADGTLVFEGRMDRQIKLRGHRIELGEIEAHLEAHPLVQQAVAQLEGQGDAAVIVAHVTHGDGPAPSEDTLRAFLGERVPEVSVPTWIAVRDRMPLTANGKIDAAKLPLLSDTRKAMASAEASSGAQAPNTDTERYVATLFRTLLSVPDAGRDAHFFRLGGHSLLATRLAARVLEERGRALPVRALFEAPTLAGIAAAIEQSPLGLSHLVRRPTVSPTRASPAQERMWVLQRLEPESPAYHMPYAVRVHGPLDVPRLARALAQVCAQHAPLRSRFSDGPSGLCVELADTAPALNLSPVPCTEQALPSTLAALSQSPFDLSKGPLLRATVLSLGKDHHVLSVVFHHIIADAASVALFARQWLLAYSGNAPASEAPALDYYDVAESERLRPAAAREHDLAYWVAKLEGSESPAIAPEYAAGGPARGAVERASLTRREFDMLRRAASAQGTTLFALGLSALGAVLGAYANADEVTIGVPVSTRRHVQADAMLGLFVDTLPLRLQWAGQKSVEALGAHAHAVIQEALAHAAVSFDEIVARVAPARVLGRTPFFQSMLLVHEDAPGSMTNVPGLTLSPLALVPAVPPFDLTFAVAPGDDGSASLHLEYRADLFSAGFSALLLDSFRRALLSMAEAGAQRPEVFAPQHRARLGQARATMDLLGLSSSLRRWAKTAPKHPAVVGAAGEMLTYEELDAQVTQLAGHLRENHGSHHAGIRVLLRRGPRALVAVLAAMRAGVPYIPADLAWPAARLAAIGAASPTLDDEGLKDPEGSAIRTWEQLLGAPMGKADVLPEPAPDTIAYIMYTSGSSGRPKGVCVTHGNVRHLASSMGEQMQLVPSDRVLQFASLAFDASVEEIACTLTRGATLVLRPEELGSVRAFLDVVRDTGVTVLDLPTAFFHEMVDLGVADEFLPASVRLVVIGGETASVDRVARFFALAPHCDLMNTYGPTEGTVTSTAWFLRPGTGPFATVPIGVPIAGVAVSIEQRGDIVGPGAVGEIVLRGDGVAKGYLDTQHNEEGTGFRHTPEGLAYHTGDLGRLRPQGVLEFFGRRDRQLKIRGHRIDPQEVERALRDSALVRDAWLLERAGRLLAYVVPLPGIPVQPAGLRGALQVLFPSAFIPSAFIEVPSLPRNAAGKVDESRLPAVEAPWPPAAAAPPETDVERELLSLFRTLLETEALGIDDDFFASGGHSLLGTRLLSRIQVRFGVDLPLRVLFERPSVRGLAAELCRARPDAGGAAGIPRRADRKALPLSFAQERLFFLERLDPAGAAFNIPAALSLLGPLDTEALRAAFETVWQRHDVLRSRFTEEAGRPFQHVDPVGPFVLPIVDLSHVPVALRERDADERASIEARTPFDLSRGPLVRVQLLRYAKDHAVLLMTAHHIVVDGWSTSVLLREIATSYRCLRRGERPFLPKLPVDYADFASYERARAATGALERGIAHFRDALAGAPELTDIPTDRPRPRVQGQAGADVPITIGNETSALVRATAMRERATPFMVLLSALHLLLHRLTGDADTVIGASVAHRTHSDLEGVVGFFVNVLPVRADIHAAKTFEGLLRQTRARSIAAMDHEDVPFDRLVDALEPERSTAHSPIFQVNFVLQNAPAASFDLPDLSVRSRSVSAQSARFDLILSIDETNDGFGGLLTYRTDLWDEATVRRFASAYAQLLSEGLRAPTAPLEALAAHPPQEAARLVRLGMGPKTVVPEVPITRILEERMDERAIAVACGAATLRQGELHREANRLARHLRARGVGPNVVVALAMQRSIARVVGLLAILKAGAAYVPLDERNPGERLEHILREAKASVVLADEATADSLPTGGPVVMVLEEEAAAIAACEITPLETAPAPTDVAYVLFTSGSSGVPKGVRVSHRGLPNLALAQAERLGLGPTDRVLQVASMAFDASVSEIFMTLASGATLDLGPGGALAEQDLEQVLRERQITSVTLPPTLLGLLNPGLLPELRTVISAGEALPPDLARRWVPHVRLFNAYGPTEASVCATMHDVTAADTHRERIPVGVPLRNVDVFVLDAQGQAPILGAAGEVVLGGIGVALGYVGASQADTLRFTSDGRFRTGDQGRWLDDGRLEILGRLDEQVKLGGQRVELAEVEHAVMAHPDVRAAAACVRHDVGPTPLLVAYVVLRTPEGPQGPSQGLEARLRAHARRKLPSYMVPARIMVLPMLPTQESGKVDRRALPKPSLQPEGPMEAVRSMSPRELVIASIVGVLTGRSGITVHDNFFELGGDSITSLQLVARAREQGLLLHAKQIFEHQTVGRIAEVCELAANAPEPSVAKDTGGGAAEYVPTPLQAGMIFESLYAEGAPVYVSQLSVRITGPLDPAQLEQAFNAVIARHSALRACFRMGSSGPVASTVSTVRVPFRVLSAPPAEGVEHFAARDRATPFDLAVAPLMRITLICTGRDVHELVWTHHHLCMDGWSVGLVLQEVAALVASVQPPELPPALPFEAYAAFVAAQPFAPAERFFGAMLRDVEHKTPLGLPERHGPMGPMQRSAECSLRLTTEATLALQSLCRKEHVTLNTVVTLAYAEVLARYAGTDDVVFGITMAGRPPELPNVDSAVGLFINTLPLRLRRDVGRSALRDLSDLQLVLANLRELAHTPLPKVRALSGIPKGELFDSILVFENFPVAAGPVGTGGLHLSELRGAEQTNYPLTVVAAPGPELELRIAYDQDRFDAWDVRTLLERLGRLLTAMVQTPQAPLRNAAITTPDERQAAGLALLGPPPKQPLVPFADRFLHAARAHEHAVAVTDLETQDALSYGDLARRAFALGLLIKRLGGGPEQPVMVCADRGVPLLVALLGAALAGAPFVLLDAMFPLDRLRFQCADAGARIVLCSPACEGLGRAIAQDGAQVVVVPRAQSTGALPPLSAAESAARPGSAAYILYTSGSTGRPKGVVALQEGLGNYLAWAQEAYEVTAGTKALVHTSVAFDLTITTLLLPLVAGAQVVLAPHGEGIDPLVRGIQRGRPELLKLTPSHARLLAAELDGSRQAIAPHVVIGGEALTGDTVAALWRIDDDCTIYNEYGPTETVVGCVVHKVPKGTSGNVPIGLPIAGTRLDIRDAHGRSVEPGIEGELYIGGHGVCREYIGRPDETARAFLVAPGGFRWYRSGDWVRQRRDTSLEYLGRRDEQIKLHGHRIELGELESLVLRAPGVQQVAAVRVSSATEGQEHLAVFVVPSHPSLGTEIVQRQLREDLPHAFLPKQILIVDALPLTTNGKVDRSALAAQALAEFRAAGSQATPRDASSWTLPEQTLSRIWQAVTGATVNSLDDDFFALGGDSIQSLQIIARAAQEGLRLTPRSIFEHPTLRAMAQAATPLGAPGGPQHDEGSIPVSPIQAWFLAQGRAQPSHYNQSVLLGTRVTVDVESLRPLVADVLSIHGLTRTRFVHGPEGWRMVRAPRGTDDELRARHDCVSVVDLRAAADQAQALVGSCDEVQRSFDIVRGPLAHVRMMLTREPDGTPSTRLLLCAHHLVMDAVSMRALLYALEGAIARRSVVPPRASFMDHVRQLQAFATTDSAARREALQYYDHLARQAPSLPATDGPEPHPFGTSDAARTHRTTVASALLGVPGPQVQPRLLTALAGALAAWTRSETNLVDVEGHGREPLPGADLDLSETVGWFTSLYPVPLTFVASHPPEQNLLATVRALEEAPLGGVAFGALAYMCPDKDLTARITGLRASVSFNFLGRLDTAVSADGPFAGLSDGRGAEEAPFEPRSHALEVNAFQLGADLVVEWTYAPTRFTEQAVRELHDTFAAELQRLADAVISAPAAAAANARRAPRRRDDDLVIALKPDGTRPKVVLVHPVGGLVGCYAELSRALPKDIPLYGIQAVGADGAEAPLDSVTAMAARYLRAIESTFGDEPIILGGWSMGAMIAMAMAAQRHPGVVLRGPLVALDQTPGEVRRELSDAALLVEIVGDAIPLDANDLAALTPREQVRTVLAEAKARKLPIAGLDEDDVLRHIELCRTNFRALSSFVPKPITQDILLLRAADRPSWEPQDTDPVAEWRALAQGQVVVHTVPGDHVTMMRPPQVATLALLLATLIE